MEFQRTVAALFCLALVGACHGRDTTPDEDYWQTVWPNTPIPNALKELLKPEIKDAEVNNFPTKIDGTMLPKNFFVDHDLYPGKTMNLQFRKGPFAQPYAVFAWTSTPARDIEKEGITSDDLCGVRNPLAKGEHRYCAKSLGTLMGFAISRLGKNIQALSSSFVDEQTQYTIEGVQNLGDKAVMCHRLNFHNVVFYCHEIHHTTAYMVPMVAANGARTHALATCHHDTTGMNTEVLYELLKAKPGPASTACHFLGNKAVLWVPNLAIDNAYNNANNMAT